MLVRTVCDELSANLHAKHTSEYIICRDAHCLFFVGRCMIANTNIESEYRKETAKCEK